MSFRHLRRYARNPAHRDWEGKVLAWVLPAMRDHHSPRPKALVEIVTLLELWSRRSPARAWAYRATAPMDRSPCHPRAALTRDSAVPAEAKVWSAAKARAAV